MDADIIIYIDYVFSFILLFIYIRYYFFNFSIYLIYYVQ